MYQVGFGDCFLVSFGYDASLEDGRSERHVLIDFGSTRRSPGGGGDLEEVARLVEDHSGGHLDAMVVSHRHKDHLSGFAVDAAAGIIEGLQPRLVVRAWTEDPEAAEDSRGPGGLADGSRRFVRSLVAGQAFAAGLAKAVPAKSGGLLRGLRSIALDQLANEEAVHRLDGWAKDGRARYLHYGSPSGLEEIIPGIRVRVLGPPTLEQWPEIARQRTEDPEFWTLHGGAVDGGAFEELARATLEVEREGGAPVAIGPERWLIERMRRQELGSLLRIVRILDDVLNNTSLILLFEVGGKRMLFPGDAQIENWNYALKGAPDTEDVLQDLRQVDLYKVGHHGSRNATPRTLFGLWTETGSRDRAMTALMSTLSGVHGETEATRVPRATLVSALQERMDLASTEALPEGEPYVQIEADLSNGGPFRRVSLPGGGEQ